MSGHREPQFVADAAAVREFERIVEFVPAFDKRHKDPRKDYGVHGVELRMVLKGPLGATQFVLYTGWLLPETVGATRDRISDLYDYSKKLNARRYSVLPADLGYHSHEPRWEGQSIVQESCEYLDGAPCYYDGSGLNAARPFEALLREGHDGVWRVLEDYYRSVFEDDDDA